MRLASAAAETVDLADVARSVRRRWRTVAAGLAIGLAVAAAVLLFAPRTFSGAASLLLRSANDPSGSILSRIGLPTDLAPASLGASLKSPLETELQILVSRDVLGAVVDSLGLQARVLGRTGVPSRGLLAASTYPGSFRRRTYAFERQADGHYRVSGPDTTLLATPGRPASLPIVGEITVAVGAPLAEFRIKFEDREDAITRMAESLNIDKKGGEVAAIGYAGPDSLTAAAVPNAIVATYLARRKTVDRGVNERRYEFLLAQADTVAGQLAAAEDTLRRQQERSGVFDPELTGRLGAEAARTLAEQSGTIEVERRAMSSLLAGISAGSLTPRQLVAYPSFLKSEALNALLTQMATLETERTRLLERRTERDPEVLAITTSVEHLERQIVPLGRAYQSSLDRQAEEVQRQLGTVESRLSELPLEAEASLRRQRGVKQLTQTFAALQAQIVDARLATIGEGGQVRRIDVAEPPKKPSFPRPVITLLAGAFGGLLVGLVWALARGALDGRIWTPDDVARAAALPAFLLRGGTPVLIGAGPRTGTVLVAGVDGAASGRTLAIARAIGQESEQRGRSALVLDGGAAGTPTSLHAAVIEAEARYALVVVAGDSLVDPRTATLLEPPRTVLLAADVGTRRDALVVAQDLLGRLAVPCLGVALVDGPSRGAGSLAGADVGGAVRRIETAAPLGHPSRAPADGE